AFSRGRRRFRDRSRLSDFAGVEFQTDGQAIFCHVSTASSFRTNGLEGEHRDRSVLDSGDHLRPAWLGDTETEMKNARYKNQNIAVLGAGLSGTAAALLLRSEGARVTVLDDGEEKNLLKSTIDNLRSQGIRVIGGAAADEDLSSYEMVVLSPGIDPASRLARIFSERQIDMIGELELGWRSCEIPVIAVTGTNGKTTTTELLAQMLNACGQRTITCGNIGKPLSEVARENQPLDVLTVEVSSFQLEAIRTFRPSISLWLNFAPDHLDRYRSVAEYRAAKLRIFENQTEQDVAVVNAT